MSSSPDSARCTALSRRSIVTPKGLLFTARKIPARPSVLRRSAVRGVEPLRHLVPVDHVPPRLQVVRALVLVLEVVGVLPDVDPDQRRLAGGDRRVLVRGAGDGEPGAIVDEPGPAAPEPREPPPPPTCPPPAAFTCSLSWSRPPNVSPIRLASSPEGSPPPSGLMIS